MAEARERQGARTDLTSVSDDTEVDFGRSREKAAEKYGVAEAMVARAVKVVKDGADDCCGPALSGGDAIEPVTTPR